MISIVLPKGSLEEQTLKLFEMADLDVKRKSERDYNPVIADKRISNVKILRPQEIPKYVEEGYFDLGITGLDWIKETGADVVEVADLKYSKQSFGTIKIILAVSNGSEINKPEQIKPNSKISSEYPNIAKEYFRKLKIPVKIFESYGATEAKVPDIMDAIIDLTETGETLKKSGLKIIDVILESSTKLISNKKSFNDPKKMEAIEEIKTLLLGALEARNKVLVKLNVSEKNLDSIVKILPAMKAPTISKLFNSSYYAVESVIEKDRINEILPRLKKAGAEDIIELRINKVIP
ncbi:MAG: ATP phosphoribosyltransferase [Candidatus Aenigmatarchaeota archaeon]